MEYFGFEDLPQKLVGNRIHELENVMTLDYTFATWFETLEVCLEPIVSGPGILTRRTECLQDDHDDTYSIQARFKPNLRSCAKNPITLTSQHPDLPLPNRTFLAIHAACCRIADLSGASDYIKKTLRDMRLLDP